MVTINPVLKQLAPYPVEALNEKKRLLRERGVRLLDFSVGDPIEATDPAIAQALAASVPVISQYPTVGGIAPFREAVAGWLQRRFEVAVDAGSQILPTSGSKEAIFHVPLTFIDRSSTRRRVLFGNPAYPVYERGTLFAGGIPWAVPLEASSGYRLEPWTLPQETISDTAVIWINYPHNPTTATVDLAYLRRLHAFCREHEILLCADECYVDVYFDDARKPPSLLQVSHEGVLCFHSLSKRSGVTGYRSGFVAGDPALIALLRKSRSNFGVAQTEMVQQAAVVAWQDDVHAETRRRLFAVKRDLFIEFFKEAGINHEPCEATLYLWAHLPQGVTDPVAYADQLMDLGILVSPAPLQGIEAPYFRLALVPTLEDCRSAIQAWRGLL